MSQQHTIPNWQKEINSFKGIKSTIIIDGNIHDMYPCVESEEGNNISFLSLDRTIAKLYDTGETKGFYEFIFCDPLLGFSDPLHLNHASELIDEYYKAAESFKKDLQQFNISETKQANGLVNKMIENAEIIRAAMTMSLEKGDSERKSIAVVVNYASRFLSSADNMSVNEIGFFLNLFHSSKNAIRGNKYINTLIIVVDKFNDIPAWFYLNNPNVRMLTIPNPDRGIRSAYIDKYFSMFNQGANPKEQQEAQKEKNRFTDLTDGMKILELAEIRRLYEKEKDNITDISEVVSIFKYGFKENRWLLIRDKIGANVKDKIRLRVKGQDQAVDKVVRVIKRSVIGLSGMQHSSDTKPKGILFLAGPTGTGKTELVKTITELLFEDERALIRFDMSEYREENSDQKLFGAPPGYVGYDQGGQLTNAVKNNPFSVLLFDEIEKAHPSIMDKFLQILEDGRMTDGQGNTVYFSETLIFFTSNVGISYEVVKDGQKVREYLVSPDDPYETIQTKVENAMEQYFKPEVLNRIGENVVVFNFIDRQSSNAITKSKIEGIIANIQKTLQITININDSAINWFYSKCWEDKPRKNGGRGIGNIIEEYLLNPLSEFIFDNMCNEKSTIDVSENGGKITFSER